MNKDIKKEIMSQIKEGRVTMKSRWVFLARRLGLRGGLALAVIVLIFLVNAFFFYIKTNGLLLPLHFGQSPWQKLMHALPYDLITFIIVFLVLLNYIIKRFDFSYKKPLVFVFALLILGIMLFAFVLFVSDFNHLLQSNLRESDYPVPFFTDFYIHRCGN